MLLIVAGCAAHKPIAAVLPPDAEVAEGKDFVVAVAGKMPLWDADAISIYEREQIATVKADIAMAQQQDGRSAFLDYVTRLHQDWDALIALDETLKEEQLI